MSKRIYYFLIPALGVVALTFVLLKDKIAHGLEIGIAIAVIAGYLAQKHGIDFRSVLEGKKWALYLGYAFGVVGAFLLYYTEAFGWMPEYLPGIVVFLAPVFIFGLLGTQGSKRSNKRVYPTHKS